MEAIAERTASEQAVLGAALLQPGALARVLKDLRPEDFSKTAHQRILEAMIRLSDRQAAVDLITLTEELSRGNLLEACGGPTYVSQLTSVVPSAANVEFYIAPVRDQAHRRRLTGLLQKAMEALTSPAHSPGEVLAELTAKAGDLQNARGAGLDMSRLADIAAVALRWIWPARIPAGKLTLVVGDPGVGKSELTLELAARISLGAPWPDGNGRAEIGNVIILSAEDDPADTIRPRLEALGADLTRIYIIGCIRKAGGSRRAFSIGADLGLLEKALTPEVKLIIIDPISAYMGDDCDSHVNTSVRAVLAPLAELAARSGAAVIGVSHLNKGVGTALYRVQGSIAFTAAARAVWAVGRDPQDETGRRRLLLPVKCNLAQDIGGFSFSIDDCGGVPAIRWGEPVQADAAEMMGPTEEVGAREEAVRWLTLLLADGPMPAAEVRKAARDCGVAERTLWRAKKSLGIVAEKSGFSGGWTWRLPAKAANTAEGCQDCHPDSLGSLGPTWQPSEETIPVQGELIPGDDHGQEN